MIADAMATDGDWLVVAYAWVSVGVVDGSDCLRVWGRVAVACGQVKGR